MEALESIRASHQAPEVALQLVLATASIESDVLNLYASLH